jgi:site-specific recombinase XerD
MIDQLGLWTLRLPGGDTRGRWSAACTTKNKKGRTVNYGQHADLVSVIEQQWTARVALQKQGIICPWVFHRETYDRKTKTRVIDRIKDFRGAWETATKDAGCPGRFVHDFRRSAARNLVRAGVSENTAMKITGHKTASVFRRYDIVTEADTADALGKLDPTWTTGGQNGAKAGHGGQS